MSWDFGLLKWVTGPEKARLRKSPSRSPATRGPYYRRLRCEPLEDRRLLTAATITSVNPFSPVATGSAQAFTINGTNFQSGCNVTLLDLGTSTITTYANRTVSSLTSTQIVINPDFGTAHDVWGVEVINPGSFIIQPVRFRDHSVGPASAGPFRRRLFLRPPNYVLAASGGRYLRGPLCQPCAK